MVGPVSWVWARHILLFVQHLGSLLGGQGKKISCGCSCHWRDALITRKSQRELRPLVACGEKSTRRQPHSCTLERAVSNLVTVTRYLRKQTPKGRQKSALERGDVMSGILHGPAEIDAAESNGRKKESDAFVRLGFLTSSNTTSRLVGLTVGPTPKSSSIAEGFERFRMPLTRTL